ncbi:TIGR02453 family protein [Ruegeria sp. 1NDH52C]|uniref:TIGR02453 family protein n=1 Tax=Ruegeria alba TaxID=2916756 RepID=A0ABS9NVK7_9RHOB|nr:TIGR02453 family protein [Ruegeria alba]MCG6558254.1 TIGR02453 family protein [Ruegeria alba]
MPDPFDRLIPEARAFLAELAANNSRDWFTARKARYDAELKRPAELLLDQVAARLGPGTATKLFRTQRDVRFSKDKTPYTTHLHLLWTTPEGAQWFFGVSPDYVTAGGGRMGFDTATLARYRASLPERGEVLRAALAALMDQGLRLSEPELKRPAPPIAPGDALADLARRKSLTAWIDLPPEGSDLLGRIVVAFDRLRPMQAAMSQLLETSK